MKHSYEGRRNGFFPGVELLTRHGGGGGVRVFVNICAISFIYKTIETYKSLLYNI